MVILKKLPGSKVIRGFRGVLDFYVYKGLTCVRTWPRKPSGERSPSVRAQWPIFTSAAKLWRELSPEVRQAYEDMVVGTNLTAKDMFFRGYISGTLRYYIAPDDVMEK